VLPIRLQIRAADPAGTPMLSAGPRSAV